MIEGDTDSLRETREWLFSLQSRGWRCGLQEMQRAVNSLNSPQDSIQSIHVAGTNGKGSVCAIVSSILQAAGLRVGLYISPHLIDLRERITINGRMIDQRRLEELVERARNTLEGDESIELTFFEFITAIAMVYFSEEKVDVAVIETGLGGRFDATNVLSPAIVVITNIGLDHTEQLGNSIESVAREKAGIIKQGRPVISSAGSPEGARVIRERARELQCPIREFGVDFGIDNVRADLSGTTFDYSDGRQLRGAKTNLLGRHQAENAATALAACDAFALERDLHIDDAAMMEGLKRVDWPGRLDLVSRQPNLILDCGHNPTAIGRLLDSLTDLGLSPDTVVYACSADKDYQTVTSMLFPRAKRIVLTRYGSARSLDPMILSKLPEAKERGTLVTEKVSEALSAAMEMTPKDETIVVVGSIFLVGDALSWLRHGKGADFSLAGFR